MGETLHVAVGFLGNAASLMLYTAPILTFSRVVKKRSTEGFSCVPYTVSLLNCLIYTWYGLPVVSRGWENFPVVTINGLGIVLEASFIAIYIYFATKESRKWNLMLLLPVLAIFGAAATISSFSFHSHSHRKIFIGSIGLVASSSMYSAPMVAVKQVIKTKSVEFMPFYLSFFSFLASAFWMAYGLLGRDLFLAAPNLVGCPMGLLQLIVYFKYRNYKGSSEQIAINELKNSTDIKLTQHFDVEKNPESFKTEKQLADRKV